MKNKILSIQSKLIYGYVGGNIAEFAIQLHGLDVISFPTVLLATHTGHTPVYGKATIKDAFDELLKGIEAVDIIKDVSHIITGYIGSEDILNSTYEFIRKIKAEYPDIQYICDPVMGDFDKGLYVPQNVADKISKSLASLSDIMTPNHYELQHMLGCVIDTEERLTSLVKASGLFKDRTLIVTSCNLKDTPANVIETIIVKNSDVKRIQSPRINIDTTGTGDLFTAMIASQIATGKDIDSAVKYTSDTISSCLNYIVRKGLDEMNAECLLKYVKA